MKYIFLLTCVFLTSCNSVLHDTKPIVTSKKQNIENNYNHSWFTSEPIVDSTSGISLNKAYQFVKKRKSEPIIIALLDSSIDNTHETLANKIWINTDEIANNNIDDDNNGYKDDISGWNFLGIKDSLSMVLFSSTDAIRIIRKFKKDSSSISKNALEYDKYSKALITFKKEYKQCEDEIDESSYILNSYENAKKNVIIPYFKNQNYNLEQLESIESTDSLVQKDIFFLSQLIKYNLDEDWINSYAKRSKIALKTTYNKNYNERDLIDEKLMDSISVINYGHSNVFCNLEENTHATRVAAVVGGIGNDKISKGIIEKVELMPVAIGPFYGNEHDKDIALGIRYAVDNGAKVINMSFGKPLSYKSEWVFEAIKYAESKNVLLVTSAGNNAANGDLEENFRYPNDNDFGKPEVADNFLMVGSTGPKVDSTFVSSFSNYGKKNVDLFAPGSEFVTAWPGNKYKKDGGTSISSAVVSAVAGLLFQYYPNLTASQVKHILMDSGMPYDSLDVYVGRGDSKKKLPFKELSKSGKVVNAYNAMLMAEEVYKQ